jgi:hypothetical protein
MAQRRSKPVADAVAQAARTARERGGEPVSGRRASRSMDVFGGEIRRRDIFPLLVLHLV